MAYMIVYTGKNLVSSKTFCKSFCEINRVPSIVKEQLEACGLFITGD